MQRHVLRAGEKCRAGYNRYMERKVAELVLIERALSAPPPAPRVEHLGRLLKRKFKSAALCRSEMVSRQWMQTETKWQSGPCGSGAFNFDYEYQRADLSVSGPPAYVVRGLPPVRDTQYTASGMAALSAALMALRRVWPDCRFDAPSDGYPETLELIDLMGHHMGHAGDDEGPRVVILDSTVDTAHSAERRLDGAAAAVFDTSCFAASSCRIRSMTAAVHERGLPVILVRSHTKLDCFGLDYGRLGSVVVMDGQDVSRAAQLDRLIADFIRLTGSAALPLHFPPFAGGEDFVALTRARTAWTIRSTRMIAAQLTGHAVRCFAHGLYIVFFPETYADRSAASHAAKDLVSDLVEGGIPARHAGSFGFDFFGCDWFEDPRTGRIGLRLSVGDLPVVLIDRAMRVLVSWLGRRDCARELSRDTRLLRTREEALPS